MKIFKTKNKTELIIIAPTQIKENLSIGNIYDLTITDFYAKAMKFAGKKIVIPFLWNINGEPLIKQLKTQGKKITTKNIKYYIEVMIKKAELVMKNHYLNFRNVYRDDQIQDKLRLLLDKKHNNNFKVGETYINECLLCNNIYGSDPKIKICKICNKKTIFNKRNTIYITIHKKDIQSKIDGIKFVPDYARKRLQDFVDSLPNKYDLIIEKNRTYTLSYKKFRLDPRFIVMMFPAILKASSYQKRTWIHGDVIKKFDYYSLCYLNKKDCPTQIICHGILKGKDNKKLRWQNEKGISLNQIQGVHNKILRAYFLKYNIATNRIIDPIKIKLESKGLTKLYVKIARTLEKRNLNSNPKKTHIRRELKKELKLFVNCVEEFKLPAAFDCLVNFTDKCWKIVKNDKINLSEHYALRKLRDIFFGE